MRKYGLVRRDYKPATEYQSRRGCWVVFSEVELKCAVSGVVLYIPLGEEVSPSKEGTQS